MKLFSHKKDEEKDTAVTSREVKVATKPVSSPYRRIILRPLVTEKAAHLASLSKYVFEVASAANRVAVGKAVAERYGVRPEAVHIQNVRGAQVRSGRRTGRRKSWKKAIVTLPKGQKIDVNEGV